MKVEGMIYYETPAATVVEVKTEGVVCQSPSICGVLASKPRPVSDKLSDGHTI